MTYYRQFTVDITKIKLVPKKSNSDNCPLHISDVVYLEFNFAHVKVLSTDREEGDSRRNCWYHHKPFLQFVFKTVCEPEDFKLKTLDITLFRENPDVSTLARWCSKMKCEGEPVEVLSIASIDLHTIASGPTRYEMPLTLNGTKSNIATVSFELTCVEFTSNLCLTIANFHIDTQIWHRLYQFLNLNNNNTNVPNLCIDFGWIESMKSNESQFFPHHKVIKWNNIASESTTTTVEMVALEIEDRIVTVYSLLSSCLHIRLFMKLPNKSTLEFGRIVFPLAECYHSEFNKSMKLIQRILWNEGAFRQYLHLEPQQNLSVELYKFLYEDASWTQFNLIVRFGCDLIQMNNGVLKGGKVITGETFLGFPQPRQQYQRKSTLKRKSNMSRARIDDEMTDSNDEIEMIATNISKHNPLRTQLQMPSNESLPYVIMRCWILSRCITEQMLMALERRGYVISEWFMKRNPVPELLDLCNEREKQRQLEDIENYEDDIDEKQQQNPPNYVTTIQNNEDTLITISSPNPIHFTTKTKPDEEQITFRAIKNVQQENYDNALEMYRTDPTRENQMNVRYWSKQISE